LCRTCWLCLCQRRLVALRQAAQRHTQTRRRCGWCGAGKRKAACATRWARTSAPCAAGVRCWQSPISARRSPAAAARWTRLGNAHSALPQLLQATAAYQHVVALTDTGGHSQLAAGALVGLAAVLAADGRYDEALAEYRRALAMRELSLPAGHPNIAATL